MTTVRAPASSANLGPGFDVLGLALNRYVFANDEGIGDLCWGDHIARIAYEMAGGTGDIWFHFDVPPSRGMGFSAAARSAGAALAYAQQGLSEREMQDGAYRIVEELEGHGDNAAPAVYGGLHVIVDSDNYRLTAEFPRELLLWVPSETTTATDANRAQMCTTIARSDAIHNLGRIGLLVAALYEQNLDLLEVATQDRLHQPGRFADQPKSRAAYDGAYRAGAAAAWLSGSGPTVAIVARPGEAARIADALPPGGDVMAVVPDTAGVVVVPTPG